MGLYIICTESKVFNQSRETATYINPTVAVSVSGPTMNAVRVHRFGGPEVLSLEQNVPLPDLGAHQVANLGRGSRKHRCGGRAWTC